MKTKFHQEKRQKTAAYVPLEILHDNGHNTELGTKLKNWLNTTLTPGQ
jgi:hypothetical protein